MTARRSSLVKHNASSALENVSKGLPLRQPHSTFLDFVEDDWILIVK